MIGLPDPGVINGFRAINYWETDEGSIPYTLNTFYNYRSEV